MALESQKIGDLSLKGSADSLCEEKTAPSDPSLRIPRALSVLTPEKTHKKCFGVKEGAQSPSKKGVATIDRTIVKGLASNGCRSFTDLPQALVSEIFHCLDAKDLGIISCVSTLFQSLVSGHHGWQDYYCKRWGPPLGFISPLGPGVPNDISWKDLFVERELRSKSFMGRFSIDVLHGHTEAVRAVSLLQSAKLVFTGGYDSIVRMWDMENGLSVSASQPLGCTIRAIAADTELLVAGGTDAFLHCWRAIEGHPNLFDITGSYAKQNTKFRLRGHEGPVTCLALDSTRIFSGSWDMSIRVWDRARMMCLKTMRHGDWVLALSPRGGTVASTAGADTYVWDADNGNLMAVIHNAHMGNANALARSHTGDLLFTGGDDGSIHMYEVGNCNNDDDDDDIKPAATWAPHSGPVYSLGFEFPWLVSSSSDGRIALVDVRKLLTSGLHSSSRRRSIVKQFIPGSVEPPQRMLHGFGSNLYSVAVGAERIVCGGEEGVVRVWDFSRALEIENRVQALRGKRLENRMRRKKVQIDMNGKVGWNKMNGNRNLTWRSKRCEQKA